MFGFHVDLGKHLGVGLRYSIESWLPSDKIIMDRSLFCYPRISLYVYVWMCMYVCVYVCMYCMYVCIYVCMYVCMHVCMCMYVCMYVCMYACMCVYIYANVCMCGWRDGCISGVGTLEPI